MTAGTLRDREDSMEVVTGRTWNYHGKSHENANVCSIEVLAGPHFREKRPQKQKKKNG